MRFLILSLVFISSLRADVLTPAQLMERDHLSAPPVVIDTRPVAPFTVSAPVQVAATFRAFNVVDAELVDVVKPVPHGQSELDASNDSIFSEDESDAPVVAKPKNVDDEAERAALMRSEGLTVPPIIIHQSQIAKTPDSVAPAGLPHFMAKPATQTPADCPLCRLRAAKSFSIDNTTPAVQCLECERRLDNSPPRHRHDKRY